MKNEDQLTDALLKEHARNGAGADEQFLKELEDRLDENEKVVPMIPTTASAGSRWALGAGVAACLALGMGGVFFWGGGNQQGDTIAYEDTSEMMSSSSIEEEVVSYGDSLLSKDEAQVVGQSSNIARNVGRKSDSVSPESEVLLLSSEAKLGVARQNSLDDVRIEGSVYAKKVKVNKHGSVSVPGRSSSSARPAVGRLEIRGSISASESFLGADEVPMAKRATLAAAPPVPRFGAIADKRPLVRGIQSGGCVVIPPTELKKNNERYGQLVENKFTAPIDERSALSTFAVDVDTASYANLRRMINQGQSIPKDSVRIEEMVNYFDYDYAQPTGKHPFAVNVDSAACPWNAKHSIVRIGIQGKDIIRKDRPATNLVFLLDVSGSMNNANKLPLLKKSMSYLLEELNEKDSVSIVVYAGASGLALPATKVDDAGRQLISETMNKLSAGGSTAGGQGIKLAYKMAKQNFKKDGVNRIILATDGDFNVGVSSNSALTKLVKEKAKEGTYLSVLGFGSGNINDQMLESITNNGNGNYSYIDSVKEGRKVLLEDMMGTMVTIAKDVKVQVVMNPTKVKAYRLIGYSNRMLPPEAFLDKKVDAGEIGAGHTVTALYEIIPADGTPFGDNIDGSRYFKKPEAKPNSALKDSPEMMFVKLAYKQPDQKTEDESTYVSVPFVEDANAKASTDMKFASAVGLFGMVVRESEHKGSGDLNKVLELAKDGKGEDGKGQREEFIKLVEKFSAKE